MSALPIEINAAGTLLDERLCIRVPAPWLLCKLGKKTIPFFYKRPVYQQLLRISKAYVGMGIDLVRLDQGDAMTLFSSIARHGITASQIIAMGLIRGSVTTWLFRRPLAWYLRCHMDGRSLAELTKLIVVLSGGEDFASIIRSVAYLRVTAPILSQEKTES